MYLYKVMGLEIGAILGRVNAIGMHGTVAMPYNM